MISRLISSSNGKWKSRRSSRVGNARDLRPRVYLEEPRKLTVPIVISHYRHRTPTTVNRSTGNKWPFWRKPADGSLNRPTALCKWIRKKRALRQLKTEHEQDRKRLQRDSVFREQKEREYEYFQDLYKQQAEEYQREKERKALEASLKSSTPVPWKPVKIKKEKVRTEKVKKQKVKTEKVKKEKVKKEKSKEYEDFVETDVLAKSRALTEGKKYRIYGAGKSSVAKPRAVSKSVSVKKYNRHSTLTERFVNACYRFCCQLYCCLTLLLLVGIVIVLLI